MKLFLFIFIGLQLLLCSCSKDSPQVIDPFSPGPPPPSDGSDNDDLNPTPTPTPTPAPLPRTQVSLEPSDISPEHIILTYKERKAKAHQLGTPQDEKECHPQFKHYCMVDGQVLFQFDTQALNKNYPKEIWAVTNITLTSDFYSLRYDDLADIICLSNNRLCSGVSLKKYRERKFWRNDVRDYLKTNLFADEISRGLTFDHLKVVKDLKIHFSRFFALRSSELQTLVRKNKSIILNVGKDIYVDSPQLKIDLKRRVPR